MLSDFSLGSKPAAPPEEKQVIYRDLGGSLDALALDRELYLQYSTASRLLESVEVDQTTPLNQKAQLINTLTVILTNIVKTQAEIYNMERMKKLEQALIATLKEFPDLNTAFWNEYEKLSDAS